MKSLLLKDKIIIKKCFKSYLLILSILIFSSSFGKSNYFFTVYACIMSALFSVSILSYDEKTRWDQFFVTLPLSKKQYVAEKYILSAIFGFINILAVTITLILKMSFYYNFDLNFLIFTVVSLMFLNFFSFSTTMPFIFKYGTKKGMIAYYCLIAVVFSLAVIFNIKLDYFKTLHIGFGFYSVMILVSACLYFISQKLSVIALENESKIKF